MNQQKKILFSISLVGIIGLSILMKQSTTTIKATEKEDTIEWVDTAETTDVSTEEIEGVELDEASPRAIVTSTWGTAPVSFDTVTGTLTVSAGTISTSANSYIKSLDNSGKIVKSDVKKIILQNGVVADVNASYLFGGANMPSTEDSPLFDNLISITGFLDTKNTENMNYMFYGAKKLTTVDVSQWNTSKVTTMDSMFYSCSSLTDLNVSRWDTSKVTTMKSMFSGVSSVPILDVSNWDTSKVTDMQSMFNGVSTVRSLDVSNWNTSRVINMSSMFSRVSSVTSLDVSNLNTSNVTAMNSMFSTNTNLTSLDVSKFDTSKVTTMGAMFYNCSAIERIDVSKWDTSNVENMYNMFSGVSSVTSLDVSMWNTLKVTNVGNMFQNDSNLTSLNLSNWNTSKVTSMSNMFNGTTKLNTLTLGGNSIFNSTVNLPTVNKAAGKYTGGWNRTAPMNPSSVYVSSTEFMTNYDGSMPGTYEWQTTVIHSTWGSSPVSFDPTTGILTVTAGTLQPKETSEFLDINDKIAKKDVKEVILEEGVAAPSNASYLFSGSRTDISTLFTNLTTISGFLDTSNVTNMNSMFRSASNLTSVDVSKWNTSKVTDMNSMFFSTTSLVSLDVGDWDTSNVTSMTAMFQNMYDLKTLDVSSWDTSKVTTMFVMFAKSSSLTTLDVSNWDTSNVTNMASMFSNASSLTTLDVSDWNTSQVTSMLAVFNGTSNLTSIDVSKWNTANVTDMRLMFNDTSSLMTLDVSNFNTSKVTTMADMFNGANGLNDLDVGSFDTSNVITMTNMFAKTKLSSLILGTKSIFNNTVALPAIDTTSGEYSGGWERTIPTSPAVSYTSSTEFMTNYDGSKPGTYEWQTAGEFGINVPEIMAFKETNIPVSKQTKSLREDPNWAIKVTDQRANSLRNQWQLTARLAQPFTNKKDQTLDSILKFRAAADKPVYTLDAANSVPIYQSEGTPDKVTDQEIRWSADTGFYLDFDAFGFYPTGEYTSVIEFSLESVPTS